MDCKQLGLCVLCLFKGRRVIVGIFYIVREIATTCCDVQKSNEQAAIETVFFHEQASAIFWIVLRIFTYISPTAFVNVFIVFSNLLSYLATKTQRHQDYRIIVYYSLFNPDLSGLKLMSPRLINEKTPVFNLYLSPLWAPACRMAGRFVPLAQTWHAMLSYII